MLTITVSKNKKDAFPTLQEAVLSVDDSLSETVRICVEPGIYEEKVFIRKENLEIVGMGPNPDAVIFRYGDGAKKPRPDGDGEYGTFNTAVLFFAGRDITVRNITVENTAGPGYRAGQALAVYAAADRLCFYGCRFLGWQDTIFVGDPVTCQMKRLMLPDFFTVSKVIVDYSHIRNYFKDCYICGDVDFIFGPNTAFFENCEIHSRGRASEENAFITAASTPKEQEYGLVFSHCHLTGEEDANVCLGRPWRDFAKTAFVRCTMDSHICPEGWQNWGRVRAEVLCDYVEYANEGPGAVSQKRAPFSRQLENPQLDDYFSKKNVLKGQDGFLPE